jgi:hypothetical protein
MLVGLPISIPEHIWGYHVVLGTACVIGLLHNNPIDKETYTQWYL